MVLIDKVGQVGHTARNRPRAEVGGVADILLAAGLQNRGSGFVEKHRVHVRAAGDLQRSRVVEESGIEDAARLQQIAGVGHHIDDDVTGGHIELAHVLHHRHGQVAAARQ